MMTLSMYAFSAEVYLTMLGDLSNIVSKGAEHAQAKGIDPATLIGARLAPDMYDFATQVRTVCEHAKRGMAFLAAVEAPSSDETDKSFDELKTRIASTIDYIKGFDSKALDGSEAREIVIPAGPGNTISMNGVQFLAEFSLPNFLFHLSIAYGILRHEGVPIGKMDLLGHIAPYIQRAPAA